MPSFTNSPTHEFANYRHHGRPEGLHYFLSRGSGLTVNGCVNVLPFTVSFTE
jgi:hypothetical protein